MIINGGTVTLTNVNFLPVETYGCFGKEKEELSQNHILFRSGFVNMVNTTFKGDLSPMQIWDEDDIGATIKTHTWAIIVLVVVFLFNTM